MTQAKEHVGRWVSVHAQAGRVPPRITVEITLGALPEGWRPPRARARAWAGLLGLVCIGPFVVLIAATLLRGAGVDAPYAWFASSSIAILAATLSLFVGIPIAIAVNLWRITRVGLQRRSGVLEGLVALEVAPLHLGVVAVAVTVGALFVGHLAVDSFACFNGVRTAC